MALRKVAPTLFRRATGDEAAFERLYERHVGGVYRYSLGMLGDAADAEDVTQTTFLNAYRAYKNGTRPDKPQSWLIAIAHNVCRQRFRQAQRRPREVAFDEGIGDAEAVEPAGPTAEELRRALSQLPPNQRAALVMRELEGSSYAEIAGVLGVSVSALETLLFRARRSLREQLDEQISCQEAALAINRQLDGRLSMGERRALRAHLRACTDCHSLAQSQRAQRRALKSLVLVPLPLTIAHWSGAQSASAATGAGGIAAVGATTGGAGAVLDRLRRRRGEGRGGRRRRRRRRRWDVRRREARVADERAAEGGRSGRAGRPPWPADGERAHVRDAEGFRAGAKGDRPAGKRGEARSRRQSRNGESRFGPGEVGVAPRGARPAGADRQDHREDESAFAAHEPARPDGFRSSRGAAAGGGALASVDASRPGDNKAAGRRSCTGLRQGSAGAVAVRDSRSGSGPAAGAGAIAGDDTQEDTAPSD